MATIKDFLHNNKDPQCQEISELFHLSPTEKQIQMVCRLNIVQDIGHIRQISYNILPTTCDMKPFVRQAVTQNACILTFNLPPIQIL